MDWRAARPIILVVAIVVTLGAFGLFLLGVGGSDDQADAPPSASTATSKTPEPVLTASPGTQVQTKPETTKTSPAPTTPTCEGPTTVFNEDGTQTESLLPDCGQKAVTKVEETKAGLGLACGGDYPVILYKSTTSGAKASICGKDNVGDRFRVVIKPAQSDAQDLSGTYAWRKDAWVAKDGGTTYVLNAVDGSIEVTRDGKTKVLKSSDWISLDNETDDG